MPVFCIGDTDHVLCELFRSEIADDAFDDDMVVVDFCLQMDDGSTEMLHGVRERVREVLEEIKAVPFIRYVQVVVDGSVHDMEAVKRYRYEYGLCASVVHLGVVFGNDVDSLVSGIVDDACSADGHIRVASSNKLYAFTHVQHAVEYLLRALQHPASLWRVNAYKHADKIRLSEFAARVAHANNATRSHFVFYDST